MLMAHGLTVCETPRLPTPTKYSSIKVSFRTHINHIDRYCVVTLRPSLTLSSEKTTPSEGGGSLRHGLLSPSVLLVHTPTAAALTVALDWLFWPRDRSRHRLSEVWLVREEGASQIPNSSRAEGGAPTKAL